jgi:excinuclease ABC subunit A
VFQVIGASLRSQQALHCESIEPASALEHFTQVYGEEVPSRRGSLLKALNLMLPMQRFWHGHAKGTDLPHQAFSFLSPKGRCSTCNGSGREHVALDFLADLDLDCPACEGQRYRPEVLAVHWEDLNPSKLLRLSAEQLLQRLPPGKLFEGAESLCKVGLTHISLGRNLDSLSGGELQRLSLAKSLLAKSGPCLHLLDDPTVGLHTLDVRTLLKCIRERTQRGDLVIAATHHPLMLGDCDETVVWSPPPARIECP